MKNNTTAWKKLTMVGAAGLLLGAVRADTLTWRGGTGDWFAAENWTNEMRPEAARAPAAGDQAVITNAGALVNLGRSTAKLGRLLVSNATVSLSNWDTLLSASQVTIGGGGLITCGGAFTNGGVSNRVYLSCSSLLIESGGAMDVSGKGWSGGLNTSASGYLAGHGPGGGAGIGGASHGGYGMRFQAGTPLALPYGAARAPLDPGSGGCSPNQTKATYRGGHGGGAIRILADAVVVNGRINADGSGPVGISHGSGGAGGGIYITCRTLDGTNGSVTANAGDGTGDWAGSGGGRIAVHYDPEAQAARPRPGIRFSAAGSLGINAGKPGDIGTLYFPDASLFSPSNLFVGQWLGPVPGKLELEDWTVRNPRLRIGGFPIKVARTWTLEGSDARWHGLEFTNEAMIACGELRISGATLKLDPGATAGSVLDCAGDLLITNGGRFYIAAGPSCAGSRDGEGARIHVGGNLAISSNSWLLPRAHPRDWWAITVIQARRAALGEGGGIQGPTNGSPAADLFKQVSLVPVCALTNEPKAGSAHGFRKIVRRGRILSQAAAQPENTERPASYELGHLLQLDGQRVLLIASLREQGAWDFCVGNDGFVLDSLENIAAAAIPINRVISGYRLKSGAGTGTQAKYPASGGFVPLGARLPDGRPHPAAGRGFLFSTTVTYDAKRERVLSKPDQWLEFMQLRWDGKKFDVIPEALPETVLGLRLKNVGARSVPDGDSELFPAVSDRGLVMLRLKYRNGRWEIAEAGRPFATPGREIEPSLARTEDGWLVYARGLQGTNGLVYTSRDGMNFDMAFSRSLKGEQQVPQFLNQGLDGSLYLATNPSRGGARNPLLAYALGGKEFIEPFVIHDAARMGADLAPPEIRFKEPFVDHGKGFNVKLGGRPRHIMLYRVCDKPETDGAGAPPTPHTGIYMAELVYGDRPAQFRLELKDPR